MPFKAYTKGSIHVCLMSMVTISPSTEAKPSIKREYYNGKTIVAGLERISKIFS